MNLKNSLIAKVTLLIYILSVYTLIFKIYTNDALPPFTLLALAPFFILLSYHITILLLIKFPFYLYIYHLVNEKYFLTQPLYLRYGHERRAKTLPLMLSKPLKYREAILHQILAINYGKISYTIKKDIIFGLKIYLDNDNVYWKRTDIPLTKVKRISTHSPHFIIVKMFNLYLVINLKKHKLRTGYLGSGIFTNKILALNEIENFLSNNYISFNEKEVIVWDEILATSRFYANSQSYINLIEQFLTLKYGNAVSTILLKLLNTPEVQIHDLHCWPIDLTVQEFGTLVSLYPQWFGDNIDLLKAVRNLHSGDFDKKFAKYDDCSISIPPPLPLTDCYFPVGTFVESVAFGKGKIVDHIIGEFPTYYEDEFELAYFSSKLFYEVKFDSFSSLVKCDAQESQLIKL